jgi:hypothetical protein
MYALDKKVHVGVHFQIHKVRTGVVRRWMPLFMFVIYPLILDLSAKKIIQAIRTSTL